MNTSVKQTGTSFNYLTNQWFLKPKEQKPINLAIGKNMAQTAAQAMTLIGYGDGDAELPCRSLDFCVKCEDYKDFAACIAIIRGYNEFDSKRILKKAIWRLNLLHFLNENNGNNGKSLFSFHVAREGSPAFYVEYNERFGRAIIKDTEEVGPNGSEPAKTILFWEQYTAEDFKDNMKQLSDEIGADEFYIEETYPGSFKARFWFD